MGEDDDDGRKVGRNTERGFRPLDASDHWTESGELYLPEGTVPKQDRENPLDGVPMVEIEVFHQHGASPRIQHPPHVLEIWTKNRIYTLDGSMMCILVHDRVSGDADENHPFLGQRLVGGQHRDGDAFELSYPYPRPGTEAVFEHPRGDRFSRTSTCERVVLRLHVVTVTPHRLVPTWSDITRHESQE